MRYNKEKALVRGKKKDKAFVRIFGGIFVLVGIILFTVCIFIYTSGHTFKAEATPVQAVILAMRGGKSRIAGHTGGGIHSRRKDLYFHAQSVFIVHASASRLLSIIAMAIPKRCVIWMITIG